MSLTIREISAEETVPLRHAILRPHQTPADCVYPGDESAESFHVGAFKGTVLVCIASFFLQSDSHFSETQQIRLRGMATALEHRGEGIGSAVLAQGEEITRSRSIPILWCNARTTAAGYYEKLGYEASGDEFEIEGIGPHYVMWKSLGNF